MWAKLSPGYFFKHNLKSFTLLQAAGGMKSSLKSLFGIERKIVPEQFYPFKGERLGGGEGM